MLVFELEVEVHSFIKQLVPKRLFLRIVGRLYHYALEHKDGPQSCLHSCCKESWEPVQLEERHNEVPEFEEQRLELDSYEGHSFLLDSMMDGKNQTKEVFQVGVREQSLVGRALADPASEWPVVRSAIQLQQRRRVRGRE